MRERQSACRRATTQVGQPISASPRRRTAEDDRMNTVHSVTEPMAIASCRRAHPRALRGRLRRGRRRSHRARACRVARGMRRPGRAQRSIRAVGPARGAVTEDDRKRLYAGVATCPVSKLMMTGVAIETAPVESPRLNCPRQSSQTRSTIGNALHAPKCHDGLAARTGCERLRS